MFHSYENALRQFNRRRKGTDHKVESRFVIKQREDGALTTHLREWVKLNPPPPKGHGYKFLPRVEPIGVITQDDVFTLLVDVPASSLSLKNTVGWLIGMNVGSVMGSSYKHKVRARARGGDIHPAPTYPVTAGFKINLRSQRVVEHATDVKIATNRTASRPIYEFVDKAIKLATVLGRMGAIDVAGQYWTNRDLLADPNLSAELTDENLAALAEAAYKQAYVRGRYESGRWERDGTGNFKHVKYSDEQIAKSRHEKALRTARRALTAKLKKHHGAFTEHPIDTPTQP